MEIKFTWRAMAVIGVLTLIGILSWKYESVAVAFAGEVAEIITALAEFTL